MRSFQAGLHRSLGNRVPMQAKVSGVRAASGDGVRHLRVVTRARALFVDPQILSVNPPPYIRTVAIYEFILQGYKLDKTRVYTLYSCCCRD